MKRTPQDMDNIIRGGSSTAFAMNPSEDLEVAPLAFTAARRFFHERSSFDSAMNAHAHENADALCSRAH